MTRKGYRYPTDHPIHAIRRAAMIGRVITWGDKISKAKLGTKLSPEHRAKCGLANFKGDNIKYGAKHYRIRIRSKADHCEGCGATNPSKWYEWANLDHKYDHNNLYDWISLCRSCHSLYDRGKISIMGRTLKERGGNILIVSEKTREKHRLYWARRRTCTV
jgi:hypothetical protein